MERLKELLAEFKPSLDEMAAIDGNPSEVYQPIAYILSLGGKRIRPAMVFAAYKLFKTELSEDCILLAEAVEMFHNFTLLHDDIMDKADLRRGKQTVHTKWDDATAILSGDLLQIKVYEKLADLRNTELLQDFNAMAVELCEGQMHDMRFEQLQEVSNEDYLLMIRQKTAVLLAFALRSGGLLAGANSNEAKMLYDLGIDIGMSFQLMDDYLDSFGEKAKVGKRIGGDILEQKKTYLWNAMWQKLSVQDRKEVIEVYSNDEQETVNFVKAKMEATGAAESTLKLAQDYTNSANTILLQLNTSGSKDYLQEILELLASRES